LVWILLALVLLSQGWLRGINLVALLACVLIALWVGNVLHVFFRFGLRRVGASRRIERVVFAGQQFTVELEITNLSGRHQTALRIEDQGTAHRQVWFLPRLNKGKRTRWVYEVLAPGRGAYHWQPVRVSTGYPLGLASRRVFHSAPETTWVLPRLGYLHLGRLRAMLRQRMMPPPATRGKGRRTPGAQADFCGLREFRPGDSPRWIHWRTTARVGLLMVREFEDPPLEQLTLIVEAEWPAASGNLRKSRYGPLERTLSLAATICWRWPSQPGAGVVLAIADVRPRIVKPRNSPSHVLDCLEALAQVEGSPQPAGEELLDLLTRGSLPAGPVLVLCPGVSSLAGPLADRLRRPVTALAADDPDVQSLFTISEAELPQGPGFEEDTVNQPAPRSMVKGGERVGLPSV